MQGGAQGGGLCFHIGSNAAEGNRDGWGETGFADGLAAAFRDLGHEARLFYRDRAPDLRGAGDVILRLVGPHLEEPIAGQINFLWMLSPPNLAPMATLLRYQRVFSCSEVLRARMQAAGVPAELMMQATDTGQFRPGLAAPDGPVAPVIFVGSRAPRAPRPLIFDAISAGMPLMVWGHGWKGKIPDAHFGGERLAYEELPGLYASAQVVLNNHMPQMAQYGMMSNRSFDAIAAGAAVVSDVVLGYNPGDLPLRMVSGREELISGLEASLALPHDPATRAARHAQAERFFGFRARAQRFIEAAYAVQATGASAPLRFLPVALPSERPDQARDDLPDLVMADRPDTAPPAGARFLNNAEDLAAFLADPGAGDARGKVWLSGPELLTALPPQPVARLHLRLSDPAQGQEDVMRALGRAAQTILRLCLLSACRDRLSGIALTRTPPAEPAPVHPLMSDLRAAQALLEAPHDPTRAELLARRARRLLEALSARGDLLGIPMRGRDHVWVLTRYMNDTPLYAHQRPGHDRDLLKRHLRLWPRRRPVPQARPIGVFLHLFYDDLAPVFRDRLAQIDAPFQLYLSTDTQAKAEHLRGVFPQAEIRVLPNRGRDIFPKFFGFPGAYARHDLVLHLHGKKSLHSDRLDSWLAHNLDCLLPDGAQINRILSLFDSLPRLGVIAPLTHQPILSAAHWGDNLEIATELARRTVPPLLPLPGNAALRYPVGSMFWARSDVLAPLIGLDLSAGHFPPEAGQVDTTTAHALERLVGVSCAALGYAQIAVAGARLRRHESAALSVQSNGALRALLEDGGL